MALAKSKQSVKEQLGALGAELTDYLAAECGVAANSTKLGAWRRDHAPFHWIVDFHDIMARGGFDIVLGNPPYAELPQALNRALLRRSFKTVLERWSRDEDLYTCVVERSWELLRPATGRFGMILPLSIAFSTKRPFVSLRQACGRRAGHWWWSHFDRIPSALFGNEVRTRCTISLFAPDHTTDPADHSTTSLLRWESPARAGLFERLRYSRFSFDIAAGIPKVATQRQADALARLVQANRPFGATVTQSVAFSALSDAAPAFPPKTVFVGGTAYNWFPAWRDIPPTTNEDGGASLPARTIGYRLATEEEADVAFALLCSALGYWWWAVASDGFNLKKWLVDRFPLAPSTLSPECRKSLAACGHRLKLALKKQYVYKDNKGRIGNFFLPACQAETLAIDNVLAHQVDGFDPMLLDDIREFNASFSRAEFEEELGEED